MLGAMASLLELLLTLPNHKNVPRMQLTDKCLTYQLWKVEWCQKGGLKREMLGQVKLTLVRGQEWVWMWARSVYESKSGSVGGNTFKGTHTTPLYPIKPRQLFNRHRNPKMTTTCISEKIHSSHCISDSFKWTQWNRDKFRAPWWVDDTPNYVTKHECNTWEYFELTLGKLVLDLPVWNPFRLSICQVSALKMPNVYWWEKYMALGPTLQKMQHTVLYVFAELINDNVHLFIHKQ